MVIRPNRRSQPLRRVLKRYRAEIDAGRILVRVPSELTLTQQYGVSRGTAHRAVMILVEAGYAQISRGKGTFVVPEDQRPR
jgi:DNA-binding GntR family transcriptional regulator